MSNTKINWRVPNLVVFDGEEEYVVQTTGEHDYASFTGVVIKSDRPSMPVGRYLTNFNKNRFKPLTKTITL